MKNARRYLSLMLVALMLFSMAIPAVAADDLPEAANVVKTDESTITTEEAFEELFDNASEEIEADRCRPQKAAAFINLYLMQPDTQGLILNGLKNLFSAKGNEQAIYSEVSKDNLEQILSGEEAWFNKLSSAEQAIVDAEIREAFIDAHFDLFVDETGTENAELLDSFEYGYAQLLADALAMVGEDPVATEQETVILSEPAEQIEENSVFPSGRKNASDDPEKPQNVLNPESLESEVGDFVLNEAAGEEPSEELPNDSEPVEEQPGEFEIIDPTLIPDGRSAETLTAEEIEAVQLMAQDESYAAEGVTVMNAEPVEKAAVLEDTTGETVLNIAGEESIVLNSFATEDGTFVEVIDEDDKTVVDTRDETQGYILSHLNPDYVANPTQAEAVNLIPLKVTLVDDTILPQDAGISDIFMSEDNVRAFLSIYEDYAPVYDVDPESEYYVAKVNTMINDRGVRCSQTIFTVNNDLAEFISGAYYDQSTGIAYLPKDAYKSAADGLDIAMYIACQLLQRVTPDESLTTIDVVVNNEKHRTVEMNGEYLVLADPLEDITIIPVVGEEDLSKVSEENVEVKINGLNVVDGAYLYDEDSGSVILTQSPSTVDTIEINVEKPGFFESLWSELAPTKAEATYYGNISGMSMIPASYGRLDVGNLTAGTTMFVDADVSYSFSGNSYYGYTSLGYLYEFQSTSPNYGCLQNWEMRDLVEYACGANTIDFSSEKVRDDVTGYVIFKTNSLNSSTSGLSAQESKFIRSLNNINSSIGDFVFKCADNSTSIMKGYGADSSRNMAVRIVKMDTSSSTPYAVVAMSSMYVFPGGQICNGQSGVGLYKMAIQRCGIEVRKTSDDGVISGIPMYLYNSNNTLVASGKTNSSGVIAFNDLEPGTYTVKESISDAYVSPNGTQSVTIKQGDYKYVTINNYLKQWRVKVNKIDQSTGEAVKGAVFGLYYHGHLIETLNCGDSASATSKYYLCGDSYSVKEVSVPKGYRLNTNVFNLVTIGANQTTQYKEYSVTIADYSDIGNLDIIKVSENGVVKGIPISVTDCNGKLVGNYTTDTDGRIHIEDLACDGNPYTVHEDVPYGTICAENDQKVNIVKQKTVSVTFTNYCKWFNVVVTKAQDSSQDVVGDSAPIGAVFGLYKNGKLVEQLDTGTGVTATSSYYMCEDGVDWTIKEITAPAGYKIDPTPVTLKAGIGDQSGRYATKNITITDKQEVGDIVVQKTMSDGTSPADIEFQLINSRGEIIKSAKTNAAGKVEFLNLSVGEYTISEVVPSGYVCDYNDQTAVVSAGARTPVNFSNTPENTPGNVKIIKISDDGQVSGIVFRLLALDGSAAKDFDGKTVADKATDTSGQVLFTNLKAGSYRLVEVNASDYYTPDAGKVITVAGNTTSTVRYNNLSKKFNVVVTKTASDNDVINASEPVGAIFGLYKDGVLVDRLDTKDGFQARSQWHSCGTGYYIQEIQAPAGYELNKTKFPIAADPEAQEEQYCTYSLNVSNLPKSGTVRVIKDSEDSAVSGITVYLRDEYYRIVGVGTTNASGTCNFTNLAFGKYYVYEVTPEGYYTTNNGGEVVLSESSLNKGEYIASYTIDNNPIPSFTVIKSSSLDGTPVSGAIYAIHAGENIYDSSGNLLYKKDDVIAQAETGTDGVARFETEVDVTPNPIPAPGDPIPVNPSPLPYQGIPEYPILAAGQTWYSQGGTAIDKSSITAISLRTNYVSDGTELDYWDASEALDGSIMAYVLADGTLVLAGNGTSYIYANPNSRTAFYDFSNAKTFDGENVLNTSLVTTMRSMFENTPSLADKLDLRSWDTSNVTDMQWMFYTCGVTGLDLRNFNTSNVTTMRGMFYADSNLTNLDLSSFDTSNVENFHSMFAYDAGLKTIDLSSFDTSSGTDFYCVFYNCSQLQEVDLTGFDTRKATTMSSFFYGAVRLKKVTLSARFSFTGDGSTSCVLPTPKSSYITAPSGYCVSGRWFNAFENGFAPTDVPNRTAGTYYAYGKGEIRTPPTLVSNSFTYTGSSQSISFNGFNSSAMLKTGNTSATKAGTYTAYVGLKDEAHDCWTDGTYTAKEYTWTISKAKISSANAASIATKSYNNGAAIKPKPTLTFNGITLVEGTDYTLSYSNNTDAGTATITVSGIGNFTGTKTLSFTIKKLSSIKVTTKPSKTDYLIGDDFSTSGMVVTAYYTDGSSKALSNSSLALEDTDDLIWQSTTIPISYTEGGITKSTKQLIRMMKQFSHASTFIGDVWGGSCAYKSNGGSWAGDAAYKYDGYLYNDGYVDLTVSGYNQVYANGLQWKSWVCYMNLYYPSGTFPASAPQKGNVSCGLDNAYNLNSYVGYLAGNYYSAGWHDVNSWSSAKLQGYLAGKTFYVYYRCGAPTSTAETWCTTVSNSVSVKIPETGVDYPTSATIAKSASPLLRSANTSLKDGDDQVGEGSSFLPNGGYDIDDGTVLEHKMTLEEAMAAPKPPFQNDPEEVSDGIEMANQVGAGVNVAGYLLSSLNMAWIEWLQAKANVIIDTSIDAGAAVLSLFSTPALAAEYDEPYIEMTELESKSEELLFNEAYAPVSIRLNAASSTPEINPGSNTTSLVPLGTFGGKFYIQEVSASEYYKLNPEKVYFNTKFLTKGEYEAVFGVGGSPDYVFEVEEEPLDHEIKIHKVSLDGAVSGITVNAYDENHILKGSAVTDARGDATITGLQPGRYYVVESVPSGYYVTQELNIVDIAITDTTPAQVTITNKPAPHVKLIKSDAKTIATKVSGATYGLYAGEDIYDDTGALLYGKDQLLVTAVTDANGVADFATTFPYDTATLSSLKADWWHPNDISITWEGITSITITNSYTADGFEADSWDVSVAQDGSISAIVDSDKKSVFIVNNKPGKILAPASCNRLFADLTSCESITGLNLIDTRNTTNITSVFAGDALLKVADISTWNTILCTSIGQNYQGCDSMYGVKDIEVLHGWVADQTNGNVALTIGLNGGSYYCQEIASPDGYYLNSEKYTFNTYFDEADTSYSEEFGSGAPLFELTASDIPDTLGNLVIHKSGAAPVGTSLVDAEEGLYTMMMGQAPLSGAKFRVTAAETIMDPQKPSKVLYSQGAQVATVTTDADGKAEILGIPYGKYTVTETTAPLGYALADPQTKTVSAEENNGFCEFRFNDEYTLENRTVQIFKYVEDPKTREKIPLAGAKFALIVNEDHSYRALKSTTTWELDTSDVIIPRGTMIAEAVSDKDGFATFDVNLPYGWSFAVEEIAPPDGYEAVGANYIFKTDSKTKLYKAEIENIPAKVNNELGRLTVNKTDDNGDPISGAVFLLEYSQNEGNTWSPIKRSIGDIHGGVDDIGYTSSAVINGCLTTGKDGKCNFESLTVMAPESTALLYRCTEVSTPAMYRLPDDPIVYQGTITHRDEEGAANYLVNTELTVVNEWALGDITIEKQNNSGIMLAGATYLCEYSTDGGKTWSPIIQEPEENAVSQGTTGSAVADGMLTTTNENNPIVFERLLADKTTLYRVTEVHTANGYELLAEPLFVGVLPTEQDGELTQHIKFIVTNGAAFMIPATGNRGFDVVPLAASAALLAMAAGAWTLLRRKRRKDQA